MQKMLRKHGFFCGNGDNFDGLWVPLCYSGKKLRLKIRILGSVFAKNV